MKEKITKSISDNLLEGIAYHQIQYDEKGLPKDYICTECNPAFAKYIGVQKNRIIGKTILDILPKMTDDHVDWVSEYGAVALKGLEKEFIGSFNETDRYFHIQVYSPKKEYIITLINDVTELITTQINLENSNKKLAKHIQEAPYGVFTVDENGNYLEVNREACRITGYNKNELLNMNIFELVAEEDKHKARKAFNNIKQSGSCTCQLKYVNKEGENRIFFGKSGKI